MTTQDFATQGGHWYAPNGEPRYTIEAKKGGMRATTIRDARTHGLVPSVTTILRCAAKPGLEAWKINNALDAALTLPRLAGESLDDFKARARLDAERQSKEAMESGSALHASLEAYFKGGIIPANHVPHCESVENVLDVLGFKGATWEAERSFASPLGFGGKLDLSCETCIVDFKSKPEIELYKKYAYDEHLMQLAAYANGLNRPNATLINVFVGLKDGAAMAHVWTPEDAARGWRMFRLLLAYWKEANNFALEAA